MFAIQFYLMGSKFGAQNRVRRRQQCVLSTRIVRHHKKAISIAKSKERKHRENLVGGCVFVYNTKGPIEIQKVVDGKLVSSSIKEFGGE